MHTGNTLVLEFKDLFMFITFTDWGFPSVHSQPEWPCFSGEAASGGQGEN